MSMSSVPSETSIKDEPLSPMNDSSNNLLSELFAPAANIGLIVKDEPSNESSEIQKSALPSSSAASIPMLQQPSSQPPFSMLPVSTTSMHSISKPKASVPPLISHGNRLMYSKVKVDHEPRKFYFRYIKYSDGSGAPETPWVSGFRSAMEKLV